MAVLSSANLHVLKILRRNKTGRHSALQSRTPRARSNVNYCNFSSQTPDLFLPTHLIIDEGSQMKEYTTLAVIA